MLEAAQCLALQYLTVLKHAVASGLIPLGLANRYTGTLCKSLYWCILHTSSVAEAGYIVRKAMTDLLLWNTWLSF